MIHNNSILILDFGSQYTQLIARRIRDMRVYCEILPADALDSNIRTFGPKGIILSGGPESVTETRTLRAPEIIFNLGCPILGICYGLQTMALQLGGAVDKTAKAEFGHAQLNITETHLLFENLKRNHSSLDVWMSHGDVVTQLPSGFISIAHTDNSPYAAIADIRRHFYGLQFHPEVTHTEQGTRILKNFVFDICRCEPTWSPHNIIDECITRIKNQVQTDSVVLGLSGGVDSAVAAALIHQAVGDQLTCIFVDTGLLRLNEADEVMRVLTQHMNIKIVRVDAKNQFLHALKDVIDPEEKRKIVGETFIRVFESEAKKINAKWLGQGTIYPDVIESAKTVIGKSHVIKSHHNVGGLPSNMKLQLVEPLRELFKDEVRKIGLEMKLPHEIIYRHPFPGPGLAIRILGEIKEEYLEILKRVDEIFISELHDSGYYHKVNQAFAVFIPMKSVGVKGDARHYGYVIALRAVKTIDFMTAEWAELPPQLLSRVSHRIVNEVTEISRVVYDITHKPPATIEWE